MAIFKNALDFVLANEGGFVDNPNDSGGTTNFGISLRFLRELPSYSLGKYQIYEPITEQTIRDLSKNQAALIYENEFWNVAGFRLIDSQKVCNYLFDMAVSMGLATSIKLAQRAIWATYLDKTVVKDDGVLGPFTLSAINDLSERLFAPLVATRAAYYRLLVEKFPKNKEFLNGWLNRCYQI